MIQVRPCLPNSNIIEQNQRVMLPNRSRANIELQTSLPPPLSASSLPLLASPMVIFTKRTRPKTTADVQLNMTETLVPPKGPLARNQILAILDTYNSDSTIDQAKHNLKLGYCPCMVLRVCVHRSTMARSTDISLSGSMRRTTSCQDMLVTCAG